MIHPTHERKLRQDGFLSSGFPLLMPCSLNQIKPIQWKLHPGCMARKANACHTLCSCWDISKLKKKPAISPSWASSSQDRTDVMEDESHWMGLAQLTGNYTLFKQPLTFSTFWRLHMADQVVWPSVLVSVKTLTDYEQASWHSVWKMKED